MASLQNELDALKKQRQNAINALKKNNRGGSNSEQEYRRRGDEAISSRLGPKRNTDSRRSTHVSSSSSSSRGSRSGNYYNNRSRHNEEDDNEQQHQLESIVTTPSGAVYGSNDVVNKRGQKGRTGGPIRRDGSSSRNRNNNNSNNNEYGRRQSKNKTDDELDRLNFDTAGKPVTADVYKKDTVRRGAKRMFGMLMGHLGQARSLLERDSSMIAKQEIARARAVTHSKEQEEAMKLVRRCDRDRENKINSTRMRLFDEKEKLILIKMKVKALEDESEKDDISLLTCTASPCIKYSPVKHNSKTQELFDAVLDALNIKKKYKLDGLRIELHECEKVVQGIERELEVGTSSSSSSSSSSVKYKEEVAVTDDVEDIHSGTDKNSTTGTDGVASDTVGMAGDSDEVTTKDVEVDMEENDE